MGGRLPDFLIIGAMKSGTTSLHDYLDKHPDIFMSNNKEIHYFADEKYHRLELDWYKSHFISDKKLTGTSPQNYTKKHNKYYKNIPERLHKHLPGVKLIYILRDPIERYKSHILENYYGEPKHDLIYNIETKHYEKTGLYYYQLEEYLKYFKLDQIHILTLEELNKDRLATLNRVFKFLGVEKVNDKSLFDFISNDHNAKPIPQRVTSKVPFRIIKKISPKVADKIATSSILKKYIYNKGEKKHLSENELARLKQLYKPDIEKLKELTGKSFDDWGV